jgi:hypothetical protein
MNFFHQLLVVTIVLLLALTVEARTDLADTIGDQTFTPEGNPYVVHKPLVVPSGKTAVFKEGCRVFFKRSTGITVEGSLKVEGSGERPVHFSSSNDFFSPVKDTVPPGPSDWDGITIMRNAGEVSLTHFMTTYSTYGIRAYKSIIIEKGIFIDNGTCNFTVNDSVVPVTDSVPYSYASKTMVSEAKRADPVIAAVETAQNSTSLAYASSGVTSINQTRTPFARVGIPIIVGAAGAGLGAVSIWSIDKYYSGEREYQSIKNEARQSNLKKKGVVYSSMAISTGTVLAGGVVLYLWNNFRKREEPAARITPVSVDDMQGVAVTVPW